jgi:hypothetical protein
MILLTKSLAPFFMEGRSKHSSQPCWIEISATGDNTLRFRLTNEPHRLMCEVFMNPDDIFDDSATAPKITVSY